MKAIWANRKYRSAIILVLMTLFVHYLESRGYLHGLQMALGLDRMVRQEASKQQGDVSVVTIGESDYQNYFCGKSPLDGRALLALVKAVKDTLHPRVIGVDIDTSDWKGTLLKTCPESENLLCKKGDEQQCLKEAEGLLPEVNNAPRSAARNPENGVVWAQVPGDERGVETRQEWWEPFVAGVKVLWSGEPEDFTALPLRTVTGRKIASDVASIGIPRFPLDPDGVVRRYRRRYRVVEDFDDKKRSLSTEPGDMNSLTYALARALGPDAVKEKEEHGDETILRFVNDPQALVPIEAGYLMPSTPGHETVPSASRAQISKALALRPNKVVLIGGTYKEARDSYRTPLGQMAGVELVAQAVEAELQGGFHEINSGWKIFADLTAGLLMLMLWSSYPRYLSLPWAFILSGAGIVGLSWLISAQLFSRWGLWFDSVAILVGVLIHQVIEELDKISELHREVDQKEKKIRELEEKLNAGTGTPQNEPLAGPLPPKLQSGE